MTPDLTCFILLPEQLGKILDISRNHLTSNNIVLLLSSVQKVPNIGIVPLMLFWNHAKLAENSRGILIQGAVWPVHSLTIHPHENE